MPETPNFKASKEIGEKNELIKYFFAVSALGARMAATNLVKAEKQKGEKWEGNRNRAVKRYPDYNLILERVGPCGGD